MDDKGGASGKWQTEGVQARFLWVYPSETYHFENLGVDGNIILKWIFKTSDGRRELG